MRRVGCGGGSSTRGRSRLKAPFDACERSSVRHERDIALGPAGARALRTQYVLGRGLKARGERAAPARDRPAAGDSGGARAAASCGRRGSAGPNPGQARPGRVRIRMRIALQAAAQHSTAR